MGGPVVKKHNTRSSALKKSPADAGKKSAVNKTPRKKQRAEAAQNEAVVEKVKEDVDASLKVEAKEKKTPRKKKRTASAVKAVEEEEKDDVEGSVNEEEVDEKKDDEVSEETKANKKTTRKSKRSGSAMKASTEEKAAGKKKRAEPATKEATDDAETTTRKKKRVKRGMKELQELKEEEMPEDEKATDDKAEEPTLFAPVQLDEETVSGAVEALLKQHAAKYAPKGDGTDTAPLRLINEHDRVSLSYQMQAAPAKQRLLPKRVVLPHAPRPLDGVSVCIFSCDPAEDVQQKLGTKPVVDGVKITVMGLKQLKKEYGTHERRRALGAEHQVFLADERVAPSLVHNLGKWFAKAKMMPICVRLDGTAQAARNDVERALRSAAVHTPKGTSASVQVGHTSQDASDLTANVMAGCGRAAQLLGGEVTTVFITAHGQPALPIYVGEAHTLRAPAAPAIDDIDAVMEKYKQEELM